MMATEYTESGLKINLSHADCSFRLADLPTYQKISGQSVKEFDFCWIENKSLYALEVKDYTKSEKNWI
jgi:hypothetical protein